MYRDKKQPLTVWDFLQGSDRKLFTNRIACEIVSRIVAPFNKKVSIQIYHCGAYTAWQETVDGRKVLVDAWFCRNRLCPMCQWRRSRKLCAQIRQIVDYLAGQAKYRYVFMTLTIKNCSGEELSEKIDLLFAGWKRLLWCPEFNYRQPDCSVKGFYRALEITYNKDPESKNFDTYHPHLHILFAVTPSYFNGQNYCSYERLREIWRKSARLDYDPQVGIEAVNERDPEQMGKAVAEVGKYTVKSNDFIIPDNWDLSTEVAETLYNAMFGRRLVTFGGVMRDAHKALHLEDIEKADLLHTEENPEEIKEDSPTYVLRWLFGFHQYEISEVVMEKYKPRRGRVK